MILPRWLILLALLLAVPAFAQTDYPCDHWVDENDNACDDSGPGTNEAVPWCTAVRAMSAAPGDIVCFKPGTYCDGSCPSTACANGDDTTNNNYFGAPSLETSTTANANNRIIFDFDQYGPVNLECYLEPGSYETWDGYLQIATGCSAPDENWSTLVNGSADSVVIQHATIDKFGDPCPIIGPQWYGIFALSGGRNLTVKDCTIRNVIGNDGSSNVDGSAIMLYRNDHALLTHNRLENVRQGVFFKYPDDEPGFNEVSYNLMIDVEHKGVRYEEFGECPSAPAGTCGFDTFKNNVIHQAENPIGGANMCINITGSNQQSFEFHSQVIEHNTCIDTYHGVVGSNLPNVTFKNNILRAASGNTWSSWIDESQYLEVDWNLFDDRQQFGEGGSSYSSLSSWRGTGNDGNSNYAAPVFCNEAANDFRLCQGSGVPAGCSPACTAASPGIGDADDGGNLGAYESVGQTEVIGPRGDAGGAIDEEAPSMPQGLSATATSSSTIDLSWSASTDNVDVTGYRVYRNGAQVAAVSSTSYTDSGLMPGTSYTYTVAAYDAASNVSAQSSSAGATTENEATPPPPSGLQVD